MDLNNKIKELNLNIIKIEELIEDLNEGLNIKSQKLENIKKKIQENFKKIDDVVEKSNANS